MLLKPEHCSKCVLGCPPFGSMRGYVPASGSGDNGVLIVLEAAGADEEQQGMPLVGAAGHYLWTNLKAIGVERDGFRIHNALSCRPPGNKLAKMPYESAAIEHCAPLLDETIRGHVERCASIDKTPVILTLGRIAFKRVMDYDDKNPVMRNDYQCYPHWSQTYGCWVVAGDHPSHIMQGNNHKLPILYFAVQRALEVASSGLQLDATEYAEDITNGEFAAWVDGYVKAWKADPENTYLAYDIETPFKSGEDEEAVSRESDDDYTILRISFSYAPGVACSVPWDAEHLAGIEYLFSLPNQLVGWNLAYDSPRVRAQMPIRGTEIDAMLAWHVLNTNMPKGLGFVTPFYVHNTEMWKHLADARPAFYNAKDSDMTLRNWLGIRRDLEKNKLMDVFKEHVMKLNEVLGYMVLQGVAFDQNARKAAEDQLAAKLAEIEAKIEAAIPQQARELKIYKKTPKSTDGLLQVEGEINVKFCDRCDAPGVVASHFKSVGKKRLKAGEPENPCVGAKAVKRLSKTNLWAKPLEFKISKTSLDRYQKAFGHEAIVNRKEARVTYDENALKSLRKKYPNDPLYPLIGEFRGTQKLLTTYVGITDADTGRIRGGMPVGNDGRIHTTYTHNPSTLRLASQRPNLTNIPRPNKKDKDDPVNLIRNLFVASPGHILVARDFSGIEAVLVGYEAKAPNYIRLAKRDVHSFYTAYALHQLDGRISANDLPQLAWDDTRLFGRLEEIKKEFGAERNSLYKHLVHAINFGQGAKGAQEKIYKETDVMFDVKLIQRVMDLYKELFPEIPRWHNEIRQQVDRDRYARNSFGYVHRFNRVYGFKRDFGGWKKVLGDDAEAVLAFKPQSNAAGIIKEASMRLFFNHFERAGRYLRLLIHDEIFCEVPESEASEVDRILQEEMERPIQVMPLPASWGMGSHLTVNTEGKSGYRWGEMK